MKRLSFGHFCLCFGYDMFLPFYYLLIQLTYLNMPVRYFLFKPLHIEKVGYFILLLWKYIIDYHLEMKE